MGGYLPPLGLWALFCQTPGIDHMSNHSGPWHSHDSAPPEGPLSGLADEHKNNILEFICWGTPNPLPSLPRGPVRGSCHGSHPRGCVGGGGLDKGLKRLPRPTTPRPHDQSLALLCPLPALSRLAPLVSDCGCRGGVGRAAPVFGWWQRFDACATETHPLGRCTGEVHWGGALGRCTGEEEEEEEEEEERLPRSHVR